MNIADFQTWIGYVDVKSSAVYFYVQQNNSFTSLSTPIPLEAEILNAGGAMNGSSGIFTAPRTGKYFFSFTGAASFTNGPECQIGVNLLMNGKGVGQGVSRTYQQPSSSGWELITLSIQSTLNLEAGDKIWVQLGSISNSDGLYKYGSTHFTGWLLEEDISQSMKNIYTLDSKMRREK